MDLITLLLTPFATFGLVVIICLLVAIGLEKVVQGFWGD